MYRIYANTFRHFREKAGLSQYEVAMRSGISQSQISKLEDGIHLPPYETIEKLCTAFGISMKVFLKYMATDILSWVDDIDEIDDDKAAKKGIKAFKEFFKDLKEPLKKSLNL